MPKLVLTNPGVRDSVTRPVVLDIVRQLLVWTGLPKDTQILFPGYDEKAVQPGSTISADPEFNFFNAHSQWKISIEETHQEDRALSMAVLYDDNPKIFDDEDARVWMRPAYSPCDVRISIRSRFTDKDEAIRWREDIRSRVAMNREVRVHDASYSYLLPLEFIEVLKVIHAMREMPGMDPYGQSWDEYLQFYFSPKARILSDLVGKNQQWGVAETQARILGYFNFEHVPDENEKNGEDSVQQIEFSYTFKYDKPVSTVMSYPLVINNQLIDMKYRPTKADDRIEDQVLQYSQSAYAFSYFENPRLTENIAMPGIAIPEFDEFIPARGTVPPDTIRMITGLTTIDVENPLDLLSLQDLGTHDIEADVLEFMKGEVPWITKLGMSIFHLMVFRNENPIHKDDYEVTPDLMVRLKNTPSLRDEFHVRLALYQRPRLLSPDAKDRLRNNCTVARKLFLALKSNLEEQGFLPTCMTGNYISREDYNTAADVIDKLYDSKYTGQVIQFNTVENLIVESHPRRDPSRIK